jgi:hypothetical protein
MNVKHRWLAPKPLTSLALAAVRNTSVHERNRDWLKRSMKET